MAELITDEELQQIVEAIQHHEERRAQLEELIKRSEGGETKYLSLDRQSWKENRRVFGLFVIIHAKHTGKYLHKVARSTRIKDITVKIYKHERCRKNSVQTVLNYCTKRLCTNM